MFFTCCSSTKLRSSEVSQEGRSRVASSPTAAIPAESEEAMNAAITQRNLEEVNRLLTNTEKLSIDDAQDFLTCSYQYRGNDESALESSQNIRYAIVKKTAHDHPTQKIDSWFNAGLQDSAHHANDTELFQHFEGAPALGGEHRVPNDLLPTIAQHLNPQERAAFYSMTPETVAQFHAPLVPVGSQFSPDATLFTLLPSGRSGEDYAIELMRRMPNLTKLDLHKLKDCTADQVGHFLAQIPPEIKARITDISLAEVDLSRMSLAGFSALQDISLQPLHPNTTQSQLNALRATHPEPINDAGNVQFALALLNIFNGGGGYTDQNITPITRSFRNAALGLLAEGLAREGRRN
jgi:hypothetical protein